MTSPNSNPDFEILFQFETIQLEFDKDELFLCRNSTAEKVFGLGGGHYTTIPLCLYLSPQL